MNARESFAARADARFEIVLSFEILLVEKVVDAEVQVEPAAKLLVQNAKSRIYKSFALLHHSHTFFTLIYPQLLHVFRLTYAYAGRE